MLIIRHVADNLLTLTVGGPQVLLAATLILRNDRIRRVQDGLRRTVVLLKQNRVRLRVVPLELLNIPDGGSTEGIN